MIDYYFLDDLTEESNVPKQLPDNIAKDNSDEPKDGQPNKAGDKLGQEASAEVSIYNNACKRILSLL